MKDPQGISPSKGNQGTTWGKEKILLTSVGIEPLRSVRPCSSVGRVTVDLIRRSWVWPPPRSKEFFFTLCGSLIPFARANAQWVFHGPLHSPLIYTSELILCFTICVHSATRHNIHGHTDWLTDRQTDRHTDWLTDRQTDRQTERQTERQASRQKKRHLEDRKPDRLKTDRHGQIER